MNSGNKGKFSDRLKKMRRDRLKLNKEKDVDSSLVNKFMNIFKVVLVLPRFIYSHISIKNNKDKKENISKIDVNEKGDTNRVYLDKDNILKKDIDRKLKIEKIREINTEKIFKQFDKSGADSHSRKRFYTSYKGINAIDDLRVNNNKLTNVDEKLEYKKKLQKEIVDLIKKRLVRSINEFEIIQSELYVLSQIDNDYKYVSECSQNIKEIKRLLSKINTLKVKYDYLKNTFNFEYTLEYDDNLLIDKILELKEICSNDDLINTVDDYKLLDEYKFLYLKIDKLSLDMITLNRERENKLFELRQRDIDFDRLKSDIYDVDRENDRYNNFVLMQQDILNKMNSSISSINSYEKVSYNLKGFDKLLGNSFKYLGLLLVNPLKGLVPGIVTQTVITKNLVRNLYNNLEWEENRRVVYEAIDFSSEITFAINNLNCMDNMIDTTLNDLSNLKSNYMKKFALYEGSFSEYKDAIKKINKIENAVLGNKIKINMIRGSMKENEIINDNKKRMVKKLNDGQK